MNTLLSNKRLLFSICAVLIIVGDLFSLQIKVIDMDITWTGWYYRQNPPLQNPSNWSPYAKGNAYFRIEVTSMGSGSKFITQPCIFQDKHTSDKHSCFTRQTDAYTFIKMGQDM